MEHHENDGKAKYGGRDLLGYGNSVHDPKWPGRAKVALNFIIHFEEGGECSVLHGDDKSESIMGEPSRVGKRNVNAESMYDYGSRAGFWRLYKLFKKKRLPCTIFATGMALERNPEIVQELLECSENENFELSCHGYKSIDYDSMDEETQRKHIQHAMEVHQKYLGNFPPGYYQGQPNEDTRKLIVEQSGVKYDSDSHADDLPYWNLDYSRPHLVIPYSMIDNDLRFEKMNGFSTADEFSKHLKDTLKCLIDEGKAGSPKMMSVGLHCRLAQPIRASALAEFIDFAKQHNGRDVWICTREQIANHWIENHFFRGWRSKVILNNEGGKKDDVDKKEEKNEKNMQLPIRNDKFNHKINNVPNGEALPQADKIRAPVSALKNSPERKNTVGVAGGHVTSLSASYNSNGNNNNSNDNNQEWKVVNHIIKPLHRIVKPAKSLLVRSKSCGDVVNTSSKKVQFSGQLEEHIFDDGRTQSFDMHDVKQDDDLISEMRERCRFNNNNNNRNTLEKKKADPEGIKFG